MSLDQIALVLFMAGIALGLTALVIPEAAARLAPLGVVVIALGGIVLVSQ